MPETIHDIIAARVDRLQESLKQTLQLGRRGRPTSSRVAARLAQSCATDGELVGPTSRRSTPLDFVFPSAHEPELLYSFKHALTQEVVYAACWSAGGAATTPTSAATLEELYAGRVDDVVELLAYHFGRSGDDENAVDYAILAAEKAQRRWANTEALALFEAALKRLASMPDTDGEPAAADRRRRQAGRDQVRARPSRRARAGAGGDPRPRRGDGGSRPARGLVLLARIPPQPHRRAARTSPSRTAGGASAIAERERARRASARSRSAA